MIDIPHKIICRANPGADNRGQTVMLDGDGQHNVKAATTVLYDANNAK
jgi:hypothetical protein